MKTLVTGGAGFIGCNFIYYALNKRKDRRIVCLDALTYAGNVENLKYAFENPNFSFVRGDIADEKLVDALFEKEKFDVVINFAAESHVDRSIKDPFIFFKTNILGTARLLEASVKYGVKRFHQVSTDEVYGDLPLDRPDLLFTENTRLSPSSPYSASKASADLLALAFRKTYGLSVTISRCSNNYGPYQFPEKLIPLMITRALNDEKLPVYGRGLNVRDWLYVADHCKAIDLIVERGEDGGIYNVGGRCERRNIDAVRLVLKTLSKPEALVSYVEDRAGHDLRYAIDPRKIRDELGWVPETPFDEGVGKTVKWYLDHSEWLERIKSGEYAEINRRFNA